MFLNAQELYELTGRHRRDAQIRMLLHMGIDHRVRADGSVVVLKSHIDKVFGGVAEQKVKVKPAEPNWAAIS